MTCFHIGENFSVHVRVPMIPRIEGCAKPVLDSETYRDKNSNHLSDTGSHFVEQTWHEKLVIYAIRKQLVLLNDSGRRNQCLVFWCRLFVNHETDLDTLKRIVDQVMYSRKIPPGSCHTVEKRLDHTCPSPLATFATLLRLA
ncbi:hypothetical protein J6590_070909, partial [Homalodisca vitripennis]